MNFNLTPQQHADFRAAVDNDNPVDLLVVINLALVANGWEDDAWWDIRDDQNKHYIWAIADAGNPQCFRGIVDFVYGGNDWSKLSKSCQDGLIARFQNDVQQYISRRLPALALSGKGFFALETEIEHVFEVFIQRRADLKRTSHSSKEEVNNIVEEVAAELTALIQPGLATVVDIAKSKVSWKYHAQMEASELSKSIKNAASKAVSNLRI